MTHFTFENTKHKLGMQIWGDRMSFHELYELLGQCWDCGDIEMTRAEECSYIGVVAYLSYTVRHVFMGGRLVKLDGKPVKAWDDDMIDLFERESDRFEVGMEFSWPQMLFIMAAWWECLKHRDCPAQVQPIMRQFVENIERLLMERSKIQYPLVEPYVHGAIYSANPYLMHVMEHINVTYLLKSRYGRVSLTHFAEMMQCASYGTWDYKYHMDNLRRNAKRLGCAIEDLTESVDDSIYDTEL